MSPWRVAAADFFSPPSANRGGPRPKLACLKSGAVKESPELVRIDPISGPGACGAQFPLKVAALGEGSGSFGFADELRPPGNIGNQPRWPVRPAPAAPQPQTYSGQALRQPNYAAPSNGPISLTAPGVAEQEDEIDLPAEGTPQIARSARRRILYGRTRLSAARPLSVTFAASLFAAPYSQRARGEPGAAAAWAAARRSRQYGGAGRGQADGDAGLSDRLGARPLARPSSVQPAAQRWFGVRVVEIKQISAYSCRGMNGNPGAHISEHAFGNALDIAAFTLADGRRVTVKGGWRGMPEEQGFLRDVQATGLPAVQHRAGARLQSFSRGPYPRRPDAPLQRAADLPAGRVSGEEVAGRAGGRNPYAAAREPYCDGFARRQETPSRRGASSKVNEEDEFDDD